MERRRAKPLVGVLVVLFLLGLGYVSVDEAVSSRGNSWSWA